jgi:hypothetical protein
MVTIQANKSGISPQLLSGVKAGEIILIEDDHHAFAIVIPGSLPKKPRPAGLCKGEFVVPGMAWKRNSRPRRIACDSASAQAAGFSSLKPNANVSIRTSRGGGDIQKTNRVLANCQFFSFELVFN